MYSNKTYKVIVVGLPKTGTSTLAVMLRMLGYRVQGPDIHFTFGDYDYLDRQFDLFDAFQDYPWCFEWSRYFDNPNVKFIILKREKQSWWTSFFESYGKKSGFYLSHPYMKIAKSLENKQLFYDFYDFHYEYIESFEKKAPHRFLEINIQSFEWRDICDFLNEPLPKNVLGGLVKKPHTNKQKSKADKRIGYSIIQIIKKKIIIIIGVDRWTKAILFFRKNGLI